MQALTSFLLLLSVCALDNGVGRVPALGWSSWYAAPYGSGVTEAFVKANAEALVSSGLAAKGFKFVNVDEGWLKERNAAGEIVEDFEKFPSGMKALGDWVTALDTNSHTTLMYGLYSCRGTCQCGTSKYSGPGSHGYEAADTQWMVAAGARWLKIDSCCGSQDHATAFADYARWRDAMNATGARVFFNLCGWNPWYAPPDPALNYSGGASLGNSWRVWGDGGSWHAITGAINTMAHLADYNAPGGYNDPDNILGPHGTVGVITESQARAQMVLWSFFPASLILGEDLTRMSPEYVATVGNEELLSINQDAPFAGPARRIVGGDLTYPCGGTPGALFDVAALPCVAASPMQQWEYDAGSGALRLAGNSAVLAVSTCATNDGTPVAVFPPGGGGASCGGASWVRADNGSYISRGRCLDEYNKDTQTVDIWECVQGATNEAWSAPPPGGSGPIVNGYSNLCLTATRGTSACINVWARPLANGDRGIAFVSNDHAPTNVTCDAACFAAANVTISPRGVRVRDVVSHTDLGVLFPPYSYTALLGVDGDGAAIRVTPL